MNDLSVEVLAHDANTRATLTTLLTFVGERVVEADGDVLLVAQGVDGGWPTPPASSKLLLTVGVEAPGLAGSVAHLPSPVSQHALLSGLHECYARFRQGLRDDPGVAERFASVVGISDAMVEVRSALAQVADNDATVLITGESGTGKEVVARALHGSSRRSAVAGAPGFRWPGSAAWPGLARRASNGSAPRRG